MGEQLKHPGRRAGDQVRHPVGEQAGVDGREAVDVLAGIDRGDDGIGIDLIGNRQLDQDPVDLGSSPSVATSSSNSSSPVVAAARGGPSIPTSSQARRLLRT